jgi:hypothetical protein
MNGDNNSSGDNSGGPGLSYHFNLGTNILQNTGQVVQNQVQEFASLTLKWLATRDGVIFRRLIESET